MYVIIIAGDSPEIKHLGEELKRQGGSYTIATGAETLATQISKELPDLLLTELSGKPELDLIYRGLKKDTNLPIIALTRLENVSGLNANIDDFVLKPYSVPEILARARRLMHKKPQATTSSQVRIGDIVIDPENYEVFVQGRLVPLTFREYELLKCFADNPGRVFTREALLNRVWGEEYFGGDRTVDVHIRRLRSKIEDPDHIYIETVRNIGYRLKKY